MGPYEILSVSPHRAVEIRSLSTHQLLKVNGQLLKLYFDGMETPTFDGEDSSTHRCSFSPDDRRLTPPLIASWVKNVVIQRVLLSAARESTEATMPSQTRATVAAAACEPAATSPPLRTASSGQTAVVAPSTADAPTPRRTRSQSVAPPASSTQGFPTRMLFYFIFNLSVNALNLLLGVESDESFHDELYESAACERELSIEDDYVQRSSKSANIRDDGLRLCHRFLSYNFFGRCDMMNIVTKKEIFILDSMIWRRKLNFGFWLTQQWHFSANHFTGKVPLGSFITLLAQKLHVSLKGVIHILVSYFTLPDLHAMHLLYVNTEGNYKLSRPGVSGPSHSSSADTSSSTAPTLAEIQKLFQHQTHRIMNRLDHLDDRLEAVEQAVAKFS
ncbi:hypothetical protein C2S51_029837 [Perilla frutescens var. frutescens]|nr:hypothetical protein C2S51_029837 [Perilla frutescens var. frutescens]